MQLHSFWESPVSATEGTLLVDAVITAVTRVNASLTTYDRLTAPSKNDGGIDWGLTTNAAFERVR